MRRTLVYFALLGPVAGGLGFVLADQLSSVAGFYTSSLARPDGPSALWETVPVLWLYSLILAYPIGVLPALLCGLVYEQHLSGKRSASISERGCLGAIIGCGLSVLLGGLFVGGSGAGHSLVHILPWLAAGFTGGLAAALVSARFGTEETKLPSKELSSVSL